MTQDGPEAARLRERFERMKAEGLLDLKITFGDLSCVTLEEICADVNAVLDAIESGKCTDLEPIGDSVRSKSPPQPWN